MDHLFGYFSAFNMDAVDTVELSKGGFEARHGGALSSVMEISGKSGRLDRAAGSFGVGLLSFNGVYETPLLNNRGSGLLAVRRSFQGPLYDKMTGNRLSYSLQSGQGQGARFGASPLASVLDRDETGRLAAAFLQDRWLIGSRLLLVPGVRLTHFDRTGGRYTEPRLAATLFVTDAFKLKTAAGYYQFTNRITREDVLQGNREFWSLSDGTTVPVAEATHLIGGASYERGDLLVDVELFTKDLTDLTQFAPRFAAASDDLDYDAFFYRGTGTARGGELLVQKRSGRHTGWASYTLSAVEESFPDLQAAPFPATHDQRHEVKLVNLYQMGDWHLSQTWIYASGKPYTEPIGLETVDRPFGGTIDRVVAGPKNGGRLPAYHRLDVALNREFFVQNAMRGVFSLTLFNLYDRTNVWYKEFEVIENEIIENDIRLMGRTVNAAVTLKF